MVPQVVLTVVDEFIEKLTLKTILEILGVSSSSYHRWKKQSLDESITYTIKEEAVIKLCKETKLLYGYRKITALLSDKMQISHNTVQRIMQKYGLNCRVRAKR